MTERLHFAFHFKMVAKAFNNSFRVIYLNRDRERLRSPESYWKVFFLGTLFLLKKSFTIIINSLFHFLKTFYFLAMWYVVS